MRLPLLARTWDFLVGTKTAGRPVPRAGRRAAAPALVSLEDRITPTRPLPLPFVFAGTASGSPPLVRAYHADTGELALERQPFMTGFTGGVRVVAGDINRDGIPDLIAGAGAGGGPAVQVFDGVTGNRLTGPLGCFYAYPDTFTGGVFVASGDVDGDGYHDIITAAGAGGAPRWCGCSAGPPRR